MPLPVKSQRGTSPASGRRYRSSLALKPTMLAMSPCGAANRRDLVKVRVASRDAGRKNPMPTPPWDFECFTRVTDLIYNAAVTPGLWPDLLRELAQSVSCHFGGMVISSADRGLFNGMAVGVSRDAHQTFLRRFHRNNQIVRGGKREVGAVEETRAIVSRAELEQTAMYESFFRPHDLGEGLRLTIWRNAYGQQTISSPSPIVAGLVRRGRASLGVRPDPAFVPRS